MNTLTERALLEQCSLILADAGWRCSPPITGLRNLQEKLAEALAASSPLAPVGAVVPAPQTAPQATIERLPFAILPDEMAALRRFDECSRDGEGYDVDAMMMKALAGIGLVRHLSAARYEHTTFGLSVLAGDFDLAAPPAAGVDATNEDFAEGVELLESLISSVERHGNYSAEATLTFLSQIKQCFAPLATTKTNLTSSRPD